MKIAIFAGGVGTRLWPLSRKNTPKQFEKIVGEKSTLQLAVDRLIPDFKSENIYIATGKRYENIVRPHLPEIPEENFIFEPDMRDVGPAVGLAMSVIGKYHPDTPVAIVWSDHFVKKERRFREVLKMAESLVGDNPNSLILIGQRARFANQNLGWIELGEEIKQEKGTKIFHFRRMVYRPTLEEAESFLKAKNYAWNPGYFVTTPRFLLSQFKKFAPDLYKGLMRIQDAIEKKNYSQALEEIYPTFEKISFDNAILERMDPKHISVIAADLGWSDVGAWEALKEALEISSGENVTRGKVLVNDSLDNLVFNYTDQLTVGIDLEKMIVINTDDVLLICTKDSVPKIKKLVESLAGTPNEHLT
ncbi:MAG: sugar phosphate nucleotidyltransferase [Patescibacteria group bacterium]|nr:sugar phosphate nucleotidyltransferase [Patescibacteria group bacterium]MCL6096500.1 sugar phosphate nucleotidyltransferase [Patescibacteria group bacterium]